jgi:hypothetical protein
LVIYSQNFDLSRKKWGVTIIGKNIAHVPYPIRYYRKAYKALIELGKTRRTIFQCRYLRLPALQREIQEGLNVVENWNSVNDFILMGKGGEIATNRRADQEVAMLALHLLQNAMVYVNTLMIQRVLREEEWMQRMTADDLRALTPLIYDHISPYGTFLLDMTARLDIELPVDVSYMIDDKVTAKVSRRAVHSPHTAGVETQQLALFNAAPQPRR